MPWRWLRDNGWLGLDEGAVRRGSRRISRRQSPSEAVVNAGDGNARNALTGVRYASLPLRARSEDDYDAEFRYDRAPVGALQGLAPDRVVLIGSVSKSLAPALRLGWIVCPGVLMESLTEDKRLSDRGAPALEQLALATLIESGRYDKHLRHARRGYGARRDALVDALATRAPGIALSGLAAGFHAVAHLGAEADERAIIDQARERSVGLYGMSSYRPSGHSGPPQLVLGFGNLTEATIKHGIGTISDLL